MNYPYSVIELVSLHANIDLMEKDSKTTVISFGKSVNMKESRSNHKVHIER